MRFYIHPLFVLSGLAAICFAATSFFISLIIAVILHELAHAITGRLLGITATQFTLTPFGGVLSLETRILNVRQKCFVYLSGPIASLCLSMFFGVLVWLWPVCFNYLEYLVAANFLVGVINLIPLYPFDGGKVLLQFLASKKVLAISNVFLSIILVVNLVWFNWWWIFFIIVMLIQVNWDFKQILYADKFSYTDKVKVGEFKQCAVLSTMPLWAAYRLIEKKRPTRFVLVDCNNTEFYEADLEKWLLEFETHTKIKQCLS